MVLQGPSEKLLGAAFHRSFFPPTKGQDRPIDRSTGSLHLEVHEDGSEGKDREQAPQGMIGRQGLAHRRGQDVAGAEVGVVKMIGQGDDRNQRAPAEDRQVIGSGLLGIVSRKRGIQGVARPPPPLETG